MKDIMDYINDANDSISIEDLYCGEQHLFKEIEKIKIYKKECSAIVHKYGMILCIVIIGNEPGTYIIYTDNIFSEFPEEYQNAFLEHEIGHIISGWLDNRQKLIQIAYANNMNIDAFSERDIKGEIEADSYAAKQVGKNILIEGYKHYLDNYMVPQEPKEELEIRIKILESAE